MASAAENVRNLRPQISLEVGGATADTSAIGSVSWASETKELDREFKKGDDVRITFTARVTEAGAKDLYDAHGNVKETVRLHKLRVDDVEVCELAATGKYRTVAQAASDEAAAAEAAAAGESQAEDGGGEES